MNKKTVITILIILALGVGGYFAYGYFDKKNDSNQTDLYSYSTENQGTTNNTNQENAQVKDETTTNNTAPSQAVVKIDTSEGAFEVTLDGKSAPLTVNNFLKLTKEGFYDGLTFHRIIADFMIQGGDPEGDGTGGPGYTVPAEIKLKHTKGSISMARLGGAANPTKASSGSQFFITLEDQPFLDGEYTAFGYVSSGMNVVQKIGLTPTEPSPFEDAASIPLKEIKINKISVVSETK